MNERKKEEENKAKEGREPLSVSIIHWPFYDSYSHTTDKKLLLILKTSKALAGELIFPFSFYLNMYYKFFEKLINILLCIFPVSI